jgi:hypothetical protein
LSTDKRTGVLLPVAAAVVPLVVGAVRALGTGGRLWFFGDQALIDIEARNSLLGDNLLGVYDRYGWHHPGPAWLLVLGLFRWLGGGSTAGVMVGSYVLEMVAVAGIVLVAHRLRPGLTAWWAALVLLGCEWALGAARLGTVWAPYAVALPAALMVMLVAYIAASDDPWPPTIAAVACASFICQADISTAVLAVVLIAATPALRFVTRCHVRAPACAVPGTPGDRGPPGDWSEDIDSVPGRPGWGWSTAYWHFGLLTLAAVVVAFWLLPVVQQFTGHPGNLSDVYRFLSTHTAQRPLAVSLRAAGTVFGAFPLRMGERLAARDADSRWLVAHPAWDHPWYAMYVVGTAGVGALAVVRRQAAGFALAASATLAMLAAGWSIMLAYGPLYPYLIIWTGTLVMAAWIAVWLVLAPFAARLCDRPVRGLLRHVARRRRVRLMVPLASIVVATAIGSAFATGPVPMNGVASLLAQKSWDAVGVVAAARGTRTVYIDIAAEQAMPEAAAIADQALRHGLRVEVNRSALYYFDPSFAPRALAQLHIVVCCGRSDPGRPPAGTVLRGKVGGQKIYVSHPGGVPQTEASADYPEHGDLRSG